MGKGNSVGFKINVIFINIKGLQQLYTHCLARCSNMKDFTGTNLRSERFLGVIE